MNKMNRLKFVLASLCVVLVTSSLSAQSILDYKVQLTDNLVKVCSMGKYGIMTNDGTSVVSVEFDDIIFSDDSLAVLTKNGNEIWGSVGLDGVAHVFKKTKCKTVPNKAYFSEGYLVVQHKNGKYMFMDREGKFLKVGDTVQKVWFDSQNSPRPFLNGYASGKRVKDNAWYHVDKKGRQRFKLDNGVSIFRSAVHDNNGKMECVIYTTDGVYLCQEAPSTYYAKITQILEPFPPHPESVFDNESGYYVTKFQGSASNLVLYADAQGRIVKYTRDDMGEVYLNEDARPVVKQEEIVVEEVVEEKAVPVFDIEKDLNISLRYSTVKASSDYDARITVVLTNNSEVPSGDIKVKVSYEDKSISRTESIEPGKGETITAVVDARMRQTSKNVSFKITATDADGKSVSVTKQATILQYRPN